VQARPEALLVRFHDVRDFSRLLARDLEPEDCVVQSMPDVSPTKWHLAHTTWFFETFVLRTWQRDYRPAIPEYAFLFNSYYNAAGSMHRRDLRGLISSRKTALSNRCQMSAPLRGADIWHRLDNAVFRLEIAHEQSGEITHIMKTCAECFSARLRHRLH